MFRCTAGLFATDRTGRPVNMCSWHFGNKKNPTKFGDISSVEKQKVVVTHSSYLNGVSHKEFLSTCTHCMVEWSGIVQYFICSDDVWQRIERILSRFASIVIRTEFIMCQMCQHSTFYSPIRSQTDHKTVAISLYHSVMIKNDDAKSFLAAWLW